MKLNKTNLVESEIIAVDFKNYILKHSISLEPDFQKTSMIMLSQKKNQKILCEFLYLIIEN